MNREQQATSVKEPVVAREPVREPVVVKEPPVMKDAPMRESNGNGRDKTKDILKKGEQLGKLYGWLVSFVDPDGSSIELREGRFFVSAAQLRPTDMVFEDDTISTPHAKRSGVKVKPTSVA